MITPVMWYYSKMGLQQGPVPEDELRQKIRRAEIGDTNLVWREGMADWLPISQVAELRDTISPAIPDPAPQTGMPTPVVPPPQPQQSHGNVPLPQPPAYQGNYIAPAIPNYMWQSVVATVLGILTCWLLALPFGIVAIVYGSKVEGLRVQGDIAGAMNASNSAKTWMILSYVMSGVSLLGVVGMVFSNS
jgi:hypothetical protein